MKWLLLIIILSASAMAQAQSKLKFTLGGEAGLLRGASDKSSYFLVNYGVRCKNTMAGIGGGIDGYVFRSVPFYAIIRQEIGHGTLKPFANFSAGVNFFNATDEQKRMYVWNRDAEYRNGFYLKPSIGLSLRIHRSFRAYVSAGYSYKTTKVIFGKYSVYPGLPFNQYTDIYHMNRWCFSTGFWF